MHLNGVKNLDPSRFVFPDHPVEITPETNLAYAVGVYNEFISRSSETELSQALVCADALNHLRIPVKSDGESFSYTMLSLGNDIKISTSVPAERAELFLATSCNIRVFPTQEPANAQEKWISIDRSYGEAIEEVVPTLPAEALQKMERVAESLGIRL